MVVEGNGVLFDGNAAGFATQTTTGELRLKRIRHGYSHQFRRRLYGPAGR